MGLGGREGGGVESDRIVVNLWSPWLLRPASQVASRNNCQGNVTYHLLYYFLPFTMAASKATKATAAADTVRPCCRHCRRAFEGDVKRRAKRSLESS